MKKTFIAGACTALLAVPSTAHSQDIDSSSTEGDVTTLPRLLVTAGRTPVEQEETGRAFTVIDGEQLEQNGTIKVADALRQVPGLSVSRSGSTGGLTQVRIRGSQANETLVLVDGVEVNSDVSFGGYDFSAMQAANIERIEIIRGPQSAFWGSSAAAGVINIVTKSGTRDGWNVSGNAEVGTQNTYIGGVSVHGGQDNFDAAFSVNYRKTDGFNTARFGNEEDGDENLTFLGKAQVDVNENIVVDFNARYVDRQSEFDAQSFVTGLVFDSDDVIETENFSGSIGATWTSLDQSWTHVARLSGHTDDSTFLTNGIAGFDQDADRLQGALQSTYVFETPALADAIHTVTAGYEWQRERYTTNFLSGTQQRDANSFIGEYRGEFADQLYLNAAVRHDLNDDFEDATTYSIATAWVIPNTGTRLHASVGTGVVNPSFFEQFGNTVNFQGNPDLKPEESFGWDIGIEQSLLNGGLIFDVTYFNQELDNRITGSGNTAINLDGTSKSRGVEVSATAHLFDGLSATAAYTYTDAEDPDGKQSIRIPEHTASLTAAYTFYEQRARIFGELVYNGEMEDSFFGTFPSSRVTLDAYTVVNIGGSFKLNDHFEAYARVENLFDETYEEVFSYRAPGREAFFGIKGRF